MRNTRSTRVPAAALLAAALLTAACSADEVAGVTPLDPSTHEATIGSNTPAYVTLADGATALTLADPATSTAWEMSLSATAITTNTVAGITVHCLCANAAATNAQVQAMTPASELAAFNAVTEAQIPADTAFRADVFAPAATAWYTGTGAAAVADTGRLIVLRRGTGSVTFVKARVTEVTAPTANGPGSITLQYAVQLTEGGAFDTVRTQVIAQGGAFDFTTRTSGTATAWDVRLDGWSLKVNSGASGAGSTLAVAFAQPFASFDAATAASMPSSTFKRDGFSSVFGTSPWYRYNITGSDNQIWPVFNVYLVRRGDLVYKVQLTGYYDLAGSPRNITIRSARIR